MTGTDDRAGKPAIALKTWITVGGALIGAFMAVLNIQITNASLPYIEGGIGTGGVNGTWISTAYLIGEIIVIPLTDFLGRVFSLAALPARQRGAVPVVLGAVRPGEEPQRDDRAAGPAGFRRHRTLP
jgi:MFS family permease